MTIPALMPLCRSAYIFTFSAAESPGSIRWRDELGEKKETDEKEQDHQPPRPDEHPIDPGVLDLAASGHDSIGVSVLCPGGVETNIFVAEVERRHSQSAGDDEHDDSVDADFARLADENRKSKYLPATIADTVIESVQAGKFYIIPIQDELRTLLKKRLADLTSELDVLADLPVTV